MNHGHLDVPRGPQKPHRQPSTVGSVRESEARPREERSLGSFATSSLATASVQRIAEGWLEKKKNTFKTTY